ncbi:MAG: hypothetical protein HWN51_00985 [Desulfobacterales bacterium]|nr:hypothetical protein [Desulfobacterales bacterium]
MLKELIERMEESAVWKIGRWASEGDRRKGVIYSDEEAARLFGAPQFTEVRGNCLLKEGINALFTQICSSGGTKWDNANARLGGGDSTTAEDSNQNGLQAATNKLWKGMMAGFPTYGTSEKATWKSEFLGGEANYAWEEFTVVNAADDTGDNLNRKVSPQGTKTSGQVWELSLEISLT